MPGMPKIPGMTGKTVRRGMHVLCGMIGTSVMLGMPGITGLKIMNGMPGTNVLS